MSITSGQWKAIGIAAALVLAGFGGVATYGIFKGGVQARVTAAEHSIKIIEPKVESNGQAVATITHRIDDMEPKVEDNLKHNQQSEIRWEWIEDRVGKIQTQQTAIFEKMDKEQDALLDEIKALRKPE